MSAILFEMARRQILLAGLQAEAGPLIDDGLLFGWNARVYPVLRPGRLEQEFADCFAVTKPMMEELSDRLRRFVRLGDVIGFYELEDIYKVRPGVNVAATGGWDRFRLIDAVRYFFLADGAEEDDFYRGFIASGRAPAEAADVLRPFDRRGELRFD